MRDKAKYTNQNMVESEDESNNCSKSQAHHMVERASLKIDLYLIGNK